MNVYGFTARYVGGLVRDFYALPGNGAGGSLHIVTDDGNVMDGHLDFCIEYAIDRGDAPGVVLAWIMRQLSRTQRTKASRLAWTAVR